MPQDERHVHCLFGRMALLGALGLLVAVLSFTQPLILLGVALGLLAGATVAWFGLRLTTYEHAPDGTYYTPNRYLGFAILVLFVGRLVYKIALAMSEVNALASQPQARASTNPFAQFTTDPLTTGIYFLFIAYYLVYYAALLLTERRFAHVTPELAEPAERR